MKKIKIIKSKDWLYVNWYIGYWKFLYNWKKLLPTHCNTWGFIPWEKELKTIVQVFKPKQIPYKFVLKEPEKFPNLEKSYLYDDVTDDWDFIQSFQDILWLYTLEFKEEKVEDKKIEFEAIILWEIEKIEDVSPFKYKVITDNKIGEIDMSQIWYEDYIKITVPEILRYEYPCSIDWNVAYEIIRTHIKENIDWRYAKITSDYDFCFAVEKKYTEDKFEIIFKMTPPKRKYDNYPIIGWFTWNNLKDLKEKIDLYLKELMEKINEPFIQCPNCKWKWIISKKI